MGGRAHEVGYKVSQVGLHLSYLFRFADQGYTGSSYNLLEFLIELSTERSDHFLYLFILGQFFSDRDEDAADLNDLFSVNPEVQTTEKEASKLRLADQHSIDHQRLRDGYMI